MSFAYPLTTIHLHFSLPSRSRMQMSPLEVRTFTVGPPPFSLPVGSQRLRSPLVAFAADVDIRRNRK